jgi:hypothetical protein
MWRPRIHALMLRLLQGCGLVTFFKPSEAAHALETLNGQFVWPGARTPLVIECKCDLNTTNGVTVGGPGPKTTALYCCSYVRTVHGLHDLCQSTRPVSVHQCI